MGAQAAEMSLTLAQELGLLGWHDVALLHEVIWSASALLKQPERSSGSDWIQGES